MMIPYKQSLRKLLTPRANIIHALIRRNRCDVIISHSQSIFDNLSLEDWLYEKEDMEPGHNKLLLWRNEPCVVIGKFQNQWVECNHGFMSSNAISLVRRKSGGGTVYHDLGNINMSFITHRDSHNRPANLQFICDSVMNTYPHLHLSVNSRHDILLNGHSKVSGTAAKMMGTKAYHHCTLLVDSNQTQLRNSLRSSLKEQITTNATQSVPSPTAVLTCKEHPLDPMTVMESIANDFYSKFSTSSQCTLRQVYADSLCDRTYEGISAIRAELTSWQWVYGKTPKFSIHQPAGNDIITLLVDKGVIQDISVEGKHSPPGLPKNLIGLPFCPITVPQIIHSDKHLKENIFCKEILNLFEKIKKQNS